MNNYEPRVYFFADVPSMVENADGFLIEISEPLGLEQLTSQTQRARLENDEFPGWKFDKSGVITGLPSRTHISCIFIGASQNIFKRLGYINHGGEKDYQEFPLFEETSEMSDEGMLKIGYFGSLTMSALIAGDKPQIHFIDIAHFYSINEDNGGQDRAREVGGIEVNTPRDSDVFKQDANEGTEILESVISDDETIDTDDESDDVGSDTGEFVVKILIGILPFDQIEAQIRNKLSLAAPELINSTNFSKNTLSQVFETLLEFFEQWDLSMNHEDYIDDDYWMTLEALDLDDQYLPPFPAGNPVFKANLLDALTLEYSGETGNYKPIYIKKRGKNKLLRVPRMFVVREVEKTQ